MTLSRHWDEDLSGDITLPNQRVTDINIIQFELSLPE